ncbi:hypothetical protein Adi01nite_08210 [Amorphoplanes digitatis]|nr:hypothetical protein Adi01nite_08210 [Actinoplanes digitatis]
MRGTSPLCPGRRGRQQGGSPIASYQLIQAKLADMAVELAKGTLLARGCRRDAHPDDRQCPDRPRVIPAL